MFLLEFNFGIRYFNFFGLIFQLFFQSGSLCY